MPGRMPRKTGRCAARREENHAQTTVIKGARTHQSKCSGEQKRECPSKVNDKVDHGVVSVARPIPGGLGAIALVEHNISIAKLDGSKS